MKIETSKTKQCLTYTTGYWEDKILFICLYINGNNQTWQVRTTIDGCARGKNASKTYLFEVHCEQAKQTKDFGNKKQLLLQGVEYY